MSHDSISGSRNVNQFSLRWKMSVSRNSSHLLSTGLRISRILGSIQAAGRLSPKISMRRPTLLSFVFVGTAAVVALGCRSDAPAIPENTKPAPRRAIVPLVVLGDRLAVCRVGSDEPLPAWAKASKDEFFSATRTREEVSIIVAESRAPEAAKCERGFRLLKVQGPLDFSLVGIIAGLSGTLADASVSIFAFSTYDTDYVMVKQADLERAVSALRKAGYRVEQTE